MKKWLNKTGGLSRGRYYSSSTLLYYLYDFEIGFDKRGGIGWEVHVCININKDRSHMSLKNNPLQRYRYPYLYFFLTSYQQILGFQVLVNFTSNLNFTYSVFSQCKNHPVRTITSKNIQFLFLRVITFFFIYKLYFLQDSIFESFLLLFICLCIYVFAMDNTLCQESVKIKGAA